MAGREGRPPPARGRRGLVRPPHRPPMPEDRSRWLLRLRRLQSAPQFLPIHQDTLTRTRGLQADAEAAGRTRAAEVNARLATGVEHLIARITAAEHDELRPPPGGEDTRNATGDPARDAGDASRAGVSRTFLYDDAQAPLLERLRAITTAQPSSGCPALPETQRISTKSHETIVRTLRDANRKLRQDNDQLRNELAIALGQLRDLRRGLPA